SAPSAGVAESEEEKSTCWPAGRRSGLSIPGIPFHARGSRPIRLANAGALSPASAVPVRSGGGVGGAAPGGGEAGAPPADGGTGGVAPAPVLAPGPARFASNSGRCSLIVTAH